MSHDHTYTIQDFKEAIVEAFPKRDLSEDISEPHVDGAEEFLVVFTDDDQVSVGVSKSSSEVQLIFSIGSVSTSCEFVLDRKEIQEGDWVNEDLILKPNGRFDLSFLIRHYGRTCLKNIEEASTTLRDFFEKDQ